MIADLHRAPAGRPIIFGKEVEPLPLLNPTAAARFLKVRRHTLACYRSLGTGPAYYKFGRWIRYTAPDLAAWAAHVNGGPPLIPEHLSSPADGDPIVLLDTSAAARFLTITRFCLTSYRREGAGPGFFRFGKRVHYPSTELIVWANRQRCVPAGSALRSQP